jgi:hypothetical protein
MGIEPKTNPAKVMLPKTGDRAFFLAHPEKNGKKLDSACA